MQEQQVTLRIDDQPNVPYPESSTFSSTLQPPSRSTLTGAWRSSTR